MVMVRHTVVHPYHGVLHSEEKKRTSDMNLRALQRIVLSRLGPSQRCPCSMIIFTEHSQNNETLEMDSLLVAMGERDGIRK